MRGRLGFRFGVPHVFVCRVEALFERSVEVSEHLYPVGVLVFNVVELLFHLARVADLQDFRECLYQFVSNDLAQIGCVE